MRWKIRRNTRYSDKTPTSEQRR